MTRARIVYLCHRSVTLVERYRARPALRWEECREQTRGRQLARKATPAAGPGAA
jgi:hypothetical protein